MMPDTSTIELRELMEIAASLANLAETSTDESEKAELLTNLRFLLNLADDTIARGIPVH